MEKQQNTQPEKIAIYVHWPYCLSKCPYCDFFSKVDKRVNQDEMIGAYLDDLRFYHNLTADKQVQSIFFGRYKFLGQVSILRRHSKDNKQKSQI